MTNAFKRVFTLVRLESSWHALFKSARPYSRNTTGSDGKSLNDFAHDYHKGIKTLADELESGRFCFSLLKPHLIPKPSGKDRLICVPTVRDRIVQRTLLDFLSEKYHGKLANPISYGFVKGRTVQQAAKHGCRLRASRPWVLKTDICSFFDQIDRALLSYEIERLIREKSLHYILKAALSCEIDATTRNQQIRIRRLGIREGLGVRQGMPLSPFFSNVVLIPFDCEIQKKGLSAIRYADDLIFFSNSKRECEQILAQCVDILGNLKLKVPGLNSEGLTTKTIIYEPDEPAEFLGLGICKVGHSYSLRLLNHQRSEIRKRILDLSSIKELLARRITMATLGAAIDSRVSGYLSAYDFCDNASELEHELKCIRQKVLRRIYQNELQIPIGELSPEVRAFLAL